MTSPPLNPVELAVAVLSRSGCLPSCLPSAARGPLCSSFSLFLLSSLSSVSSPVCLFRLGRNLFQPHNQQLLHIVHSLATMLFVKALSLDRFAFPFPNPSALRFRPWAVAHRLFSILVWISFSNPLASAGKVDNLRHDLVKTESANDVR